MNKVEQFHNQESALRDILKLSFPYCKDSNPNESEFIEINKLAHEALKKIEKLVIQKPE